MIGVTDPKDRKRSRPDRMTRAPRKRQRTALCKNIPRRPVRHQLCVRAFKTRAFGAIGNDFYVAEKVRFWIAAGGIVGSEFVIAGEIKQQARLRRVSVAATPTANDQDKNYCLHHYSPCPSVRSLCLCGEIIERAINHRDTEITQNSTEKSFTWLAPYRVP